MSPARPTLAGMSDDTPKTVLWDDVPAGTPVHVDQEDTARVTGGPLVGCIIVKTDADLTAEEVGERMRKVVSLGAHQAPEHVCEPEWRPPLIEMDVPETAPVAVQVKFPDGIADLFVRSASRMTTGDLVLALGEQHDDPWSLERSLALADALVDDPNSPHLIEGTRLWWQEEAARHKSATGGVRAQLERERTAAMHREQQLQDQVDAQRRMTVRVDAAHRDDLKFRTTRQNALAAIAARRVRHARVTAAGAVVLAVVAAVARRR